MFIQNYEDGDLTDDDFADILGKFGKTPTDFGFDITVAPDEFKTNVLPPGVMTLLS